MEILLNAYFSYQHPEIMVGSFMGRGYVNNHHNSFNSNIERGQSISLSIDTFIESSPICQKSIQLLSPIARKYSSKILRLYYDHLLARNWEQYSDIPYEVFCSDVIEVLKNHNDVFPYKPKRIANRIIRKNLISSIRTINGLNEYIKDMTRYNSYNSIIQESIGDLVKNYDSFNKDFSLIFPEMENEFSPELEKVIA
jgi:acyl carrier protein phosphodiesterase